MLNFPPLCLLLVLSGLYLISLGCGSMMPGNLPLPASPNGSAGAASVSISPQTAALNAGDSLQFTATSSGPPTADLEWLANGVPGGNSATGTISRSGLYTAPQQVTSNAKIVVAVRSKSRPYKRQHCNHNGPAWACRDNGLPIPGRGKPIRRPNSTIHSNGKRDDKSGDQLVCERQ